MCDVECIKELTTLLSAASTRSATLKTIFERSDDAAFLEAAASTQLACVVRDLFVQAEADQLQLFHSLLINLAASQPLALQLLDSDAFLSLLVDSVRPNHAHCSPRVRILANLSHWDACIDKIAVAISNAQRCSDLIELVRHADSAVRSVALDLLVNVARSSSLRAELIRSPSHLSSLTSLLTHNDSYVRQQVAAALRNCCFDDDAHNWLLRGPTDVLPHLLLPLAGPGDEMDEEDNDQLPVLLQYLPADKLRESDVQTRLRLVEAIHQLCARRDGCAVVKQRRAYFVLRELHKRESERRVQVAVENVVDLLIADDAHVRCDDLKTLDVPSHLLQRFDQMDREALI